MSISDEINAELKDAMRTKDAARRDVVRQIRAELGIARTAPGFSGEEDDEFHRAVIAAYVKRMQKALAEYEGLGERGETMAGKLRYEVDYLSRWLPSKMDESATKALVDETIESMGVEGDPAAAGRVIGAIMRSHRDHVDGALVNALVKKRLGA